MDKSRQAILLNSGIVLTMMQKSLAWFFGHPKRWAHLRRIPMRHLRWMLIAVFLLFSVIGFHIDIIGGGVLPYPVAVTYAILSGLNAVLWVFSLARLRIIFLLGLTILQFYLGHLNSLLATWIIRTFDLHEVPAREGLHFAGTAILILVIAAYSFFSRYMGITGEEAFRIKTELELAHTIQKTLVPEISKSVSGFDIFGVSHPSEKVGGDLVDVVQLRCGDTVAYLADIAGHGLQAGILMGMLKTAARTVLTDQGDPTAGEDGRATLSMLMERINLVLPQVKEAHMYATFTALRLNADGQAFYGMAASPPLLHWSAARQQMIRIEEQQFPLGLISVSSFPASALSLESGDVVLIATDGILEVNSRTEKDSTEEYGVDALEELLRTHSGLPLPQLAGMILESVRRYGAQVDDQTLLLVRKTAA